MRIAPRGEQLSGNAGAMLLHAVDDAVGVTKQIAGDLHDPRNPELIRYGMTELLRTRRRFQRSTDPHVPFASFSTTIHR